MCMGLAGKLYLIVVCKSGSNECDCIVLDSLIDKQSEFIHCLTPTAFVFMSLGSVDSLARC